MKEIFILGKFKLLLSLVLLFLFANIIETEAFPKNNTLNSLIKEYSFLSCYESSDSVPWFFGEITKNKCTEIFKPNISDDKTTAQIIINRFKSNIENRNAISQRTVMGFGWLTISIGLTDSFNCVHFINPNEGWIAADTSGILHTIDGGLTWDLFNLVGVQSDYNHVYYINDQIGLISGKHTYYRTLDGSNNWQGKTDTSSVIKRNASFLANSNFIWLVGGNYSNCERRKIWRVTPGQTIAQDILFPDACATTLHDVFMNSIDIGWIVGGPGEIWKTTNGSSTIPGPTWNMQNSNTTEPLNSIFMFNDQVGWIVGNNGTILHTTDGGVNWGSQVSGIVNNLFGVSFINESKGIAVGEGGSIIRTENGGQTWVDEFSGLTETLKSIYYIDASNAYAVGYNGTILKYTQLPPSIPILLDPPNASIDLPLSVMLSWNTSSGADTYNIQVSDDASFSNLIKNEVGNLTTSTVVSGLNLSTTYYWHVSAVNNLGNSNWSEIWSFTTQPSAPGIPVLLNPLNGSFDQSLDPVLTWNEANGAADYALEVSTSSDFTNPIFSGSSITSTSQIIPGLLNATTYYWRVNASNPGGTSDWSDAWSFTTKDVVGTSNISLSKLIKVYPNPTNNILYIEGLENEDATISISSLEGKLMMLSTGKRRVKLSLNDFQKGIYLIRISTALGMVIKKIVKQ